MPKSLPQRTSRPQPFLWLAGAFLLFLFAGAIASRITDWWWFREVGFERVFLLQIGAQWTLGLLAGVGGFALLYGNARIALRGIELVRESVRVLAEGGIETRDRLMVRLAELLALPVSLGGALLIALSAGAQWRTLVQFAYRTPFGEVDPIFGRDIAYYVFTLPTLELGLDLITVILVFSLVLIVVPIYLARGDIGLRGAKLRVDPGVSLHTATLVALLLLVHAARIAFVRAPSLLFGTHGPLQGASLTDVSIVLPSLYVMATLLAAGCIAVLWGARRGLVVRTAGGVIGGYVLLSIVFTGLIPTLYQRLVVQPNELAKEAPQIAHHIAATRKAWGLDAVEKRELDGAQELTARDLEANRATLDNVRLWDRGPLLRTFGQLQSIRTYYEFIAVDDDRYQVKGSLRHVLLSARELDVASLPTRTFVNEHLTFTHGMGLTMGPTNEITPEGLPVLWVQDLPPTSSVDRGVTRPQIYFGELASTFALAPSRQREFDHPAAEGDEGVYSTYAGAAGVPINSFVRKALFALRFRSLNILLSGDLTDSTRVLFYRNVRERSEKALPFLRFDPDPFLIVTDSGHLVWMLDAYTATDHYPYSARMRDGTNYLRNSVKVTVDAYDGTIKAYLSDPTDPMINTLSRIYPGLLRPMEEMPADVRSHVRYPEELFNAQTQLYATFHMTDAETFYHREDQWQIPGTDQGAQSTGFQRHIVMRLPGEKEAEYLIMRPFTPRQKDNLAAWMVARNDGANYGKLIAYRFPRQSLVFGPTQVASRINQDTEVSRQVSLWDQGGSEVIRGELLVIPIEASLLYVQPLYLQSQGGKIPELKRVVVAHEGRVVMDETFLGALQIMFGGSGATRPGAVSATAAVTTGVTATAAGGDAQRAALVTEASQHYERARAAQRADDWATYGREMQLLGEVLKRLRELGVPR
jgi:uncharacterized protein